MSRLQIASYRFLPTFPSQLFLSSSEVIEISGYPSDVLEKPGGFDQFIVKTDFSKRELVIRHAIWTKKTYSLEYGFYHADGTVHTFVERGNICTNACDMWIDTILIDITEQNKAYSELLIECNLYKKAFDAIDDYISISSPDGQRLFVNKSLSDRIGLSHDSCVGTFFGSFGSDKFPVTNNSPHSSVLLEHNQSDEIFDDISKKVYSNTRSPIYSNNGNHVGCIQISRDISLAKYHEESLIHKVEKITTKLIELNQVLHQLEEANVILEKEALKQVEDITQLIRILEEKDLLIQQLVNQKEFFISQLAHDLRTPLTPIIAMLPFIIDSNQDPDSKELLNIFHGCINNLQDMVNTIIQYANLNQLSSIDDYETIYLDYLIDDALKVNSFMITEKELTVNVNLPPETSISLSKNLAPVIFRNLLSNAVAYNIFRGMILIQGTVSRGEMKISIADSGVGIPSHLLETMWDEFVIGDKARKNPCSKGLGLSIVKQIVTMHGGSITGTSNGIGTGATFTITLPMQQKELPLMCKVSANTQIHQ